MLRFRMAGVAIVLAAASVAAQDTVRIQSTNPPAWGPAVRLVRELSIGRIDGPPEYAFGAVGEVAAFSNGTLFIHDSKDTVLRRYDRTGKFLGQVGRGGAGPGEFRMVAGMAVIGDSLLAIYDPRNVRVSFFTAAGKFVSSFNASFGSVLYTEHTFDATTDGLVAVQGAIRDPAGSADDPIVGKWMLFRMNGTRVDSLVVPRTTRTRRQFNVGSRSSFGERSLEYFAPTRSLITAHSSPYRFAISDRFGKTTVVERPYTPVEIGREERSEWQAWATWFEDAAKRQGQPVIKYEIPTRKPAMRSIFADRFGRVWVEVYVAATKQQLPPPATPSTRPRLTWYEPTTYDVFEPSGVYLGRLEIPYRGVLKWIERDRVWLRTNGPDDEHVVASYRIDRGR
jgi:hypothetical protein